MGDGQRQGGPGAPPAEGLAAGEREQLAWTLDSRFAAHLEAAGAAVREAERALAGARERLAQAEQAAARSQYTSDPLTFMRQSVAQELEGLERKTTEKKVRASYRFLLDRSVELAAAEVARFHDDRAVEQRELETGVDACREAERRALEVLAAARTMQEQVQAAERSAREGLGTLLDKLDGTPG